MEAYAFWQPGKPDAKSSTVQQKNAAVQASSFQTYILGTDIKEADFLVNDHDQADTKFNQIEYAITTALLNLYNGNPEVFNKIVKDVHAEISRETDLAAMADKYPVLNNLLNQSFAARLPEFANYSTWQSFIADHYAYDINYKPILMFANLTEVNTDLPAYLAAPFEINEEKFTSFNDNIPMWFKSGTEAALTTIDEGMALSLHNPVLIVSNADMNQQYPNPVPFEQEPLPSSPPPSQTMSCNLSTHFHEHISHKKFKITERFESSDRSEYMVDYVSMIGFDPTTYSWHFYSNNVQRSYKKEVTKNQINTEITADFKVFSPDLINSPYCFDIPALNAPNQYGVPGMRYFGFSAVERDWFRKRKLTMTLKNPFGEEKPFKRGMKYESDYYFFKPSENNGYDFTARHPSQYSTFTKTENGTIYLDRWH